MLSVCPFLLVTTHMWIDQVDHKMIPVLSIATFSHVKFLLYHKNNGLCKRADECIHIFCLYKDRKNLWKEKIALTVENVIYKSGCKDPLDAPGKCRNICHVWAPKTFKNVTIYNLLSRSPRIITTQYKTWQEQL